MTRQTSDHILELARRIEGIRFAMLTSVSFEGTSLRSRPMTTQEAEFDGDVWFMTSTEQELVDELEKHPAVNVAYAHPNQSLWVSLSGQAEVFRDQAKIDELWNPFVAAYFPEGKDDPKIRLIRVAVEQAEYWDSPSSRIVRLFNIAKAAVTGQRDGQGEHGKIDLR